MFVGVGLALLEGSQRLFDFIANPLIFVTSATFLLWVYFEHKIGVVHGRYSYGPTYEVHRRKEPVLFYIWIVLYSVLGIFMTALFAILVFYDPNFLR